MPFVRRTPQGAIDSLHRRDEGGAEFLPDDHPDVRAFLGAESLLLLNDDQWTNPVRTALRRVGDLLRSIWRRLLAGYPDLFAVCRFGDDLGFKSSTLLVPEDIRTLVVPQYRRIVDLVHSAGKPFLLHSCGRIFEVMDDLIVGARIDAKHSNEDQIAPFALWIERYGERIGLFGGVDMDVLCRCSEAEVRDYTRKVIAGSRGQRGFALGSGNAIPDYVPASGYLAMVEAARESRGDF